PSISADGLELYFTSDRPGGQGGNDIWVSRRATTEDDWGQPVNLGPTVNSPYSDVSPSISADGLTLYFDDFGGSRPGGTGGVDLWVMTRPTKDDEWEEPVNLTTVNSGARDGGPSISADGLELFLYSSRSGGYGSNDIWVARRPTTNDPWGTPVKLGPTVNTSSGDCCPSISPDGRTLFFGSTRSGSISSDLWVTTRASVSDPWGEPVNLGPTVNSSSLEDAPSISADGSTLYFFSNKPGGYGSYDLWQVSIKPVVDFNGDGKVDTVDMNIMVEHWGTDEPACDIGPTPLGDGIVDAQDMLVLTEYLTKEKVDVEADLAAIEEVLNQYAVTANAGDFEGWLSLHADDVVKMPPDAPAIFGIEDLRANFKPAFESFDTYCVIYPEETQVDGDMGLARGTYSISITPKGGGETIDVMKDGKYLTICKRQPDGTWKISHDCYNSNIPPVQ
ncbi:MAG: DUF4440 domain-containing protein, partial [Phycisphaerae bacterium]